MLLYTALFLNPRGAESAVNMPPIVSAGSPRTITLPGWAWINGVVKDDGLPSPATLSVSWSKASGPGPVKFTSPQTAITFASFTTPGVYTLRLTATDGALTSASNVTITVLPANTAPVVSAGEDQTITLPAAAALSGRVTDDGQPAGSPLKSSWSLVSGPDAVAFIDAASPTTTVSFSKAGSYVLRLTASDGVLSSSSSVTVTVNPAPIVSGVSVGINMSEAEYSWGSFPGAADLAYLKANRIG